MANKRKKEKGSKLLSLLRYLVPTAVLFIYIICLLIFASGAAKKNGRAYAEEKLQSYDRAVADKLNYELGAIRTAVEADASRIGNSADAGRGMPLIKKLMPDRDILEGYVADADGKAFDIEGNEINVSGEDWFEDAREGISDGSSYVSEALPEDGDYVITIAAPSADGKGLAAVRITADFFKNIPSLSEFDGRTQYIFADPGGVILSAVGGRGLLKGSNIFEGKLLFTGSEPASVIKRNILGEHSGIAYCSLDGEDRALIYRPVKSNGWKVMELATGSYIDTETEKYFAPSKNVYIRITVALIAFLAYIIVMNLVIGMIYRQDQKKLKSKAETDLLTGVLNKISTQQTIQEYLDMVGEEEPGMLMLFDIDNFKKINDTRGHAFGDEVLKAVGQQLPTIYRTTDIVGRLGGDEFCVFLKDIPDENARIHMGEVTAGFFRDFKVGEYSKYDVTASIGAAMFPKDGKDFDELYKAADKAVYAAKEHGRNRLVFFGEEPDDGERGSKQVNT